MALCTLYPPPHHHETGTANTQPRRFFERRFCGADRHPPSPLWAETLQLGEHGLPKYLPTLNSPQQHSTTLNSPQQHSTALLQLYKVGSASGGRVAVPSEGALGAP